MKLNFYGNVLKFVVVEDIAWHALSMKKWDDASLTYKDHNALYYLRHYMSTSSKHVELYRFNSGCMSYRLIGMFKLINE